MAYEEALADRIRDAVPRGVILDEKKMFGGLCYLLHGNMACGIVGDRLMLRLSRELVQEYRKEPDTADMDFTGRPMPSMMYVEPDGIADDDQLRTWVERALDFAATLPPK